MSQQPQQQGEDTQLNQHNNSDGVAEMASSTETANAAHQNGNGGAPSNGKGRAGALGGIFGKVYAFGGIRFLVLMILCLQNSMFTVLRRYSLGVLKEDYSKVRRERNEKNVMQLKCCRRGSTCCAMYGTSAFAQLNLLHVIAPFTPPLYHEMQLLVLTHKSFTLLHCFSHTTITLVTCDCLLVCTLKNHSTNVSSSRRQSRWSFRP